MKMLLPILLRCHPAAFLELPVKIGNVFDSDLVTDLLGGEACGGKQAFCGCHAFILLSDAPVFVLKMWDR